MHPVDVVRNEQRTSVTGMQRAVVAAEEANNGGGGTAPANDYYYRYVPAGAMSVWVVTHSFNRVPHVTVYDESGREMDSDVYSTTTAVTITHGEPLFGSAVLIA